MLGSFRSRIDLCTTKMDGAQNCGRLRIESRNRDSRLVDRLVPQLSLISAFVQVECSLDLLDFVAKYLAYMGVEGEHRLSWTTDSCREKLTITKNLVYRKPEEERQSFGKVEIIASTSKSGLYVLIINSGESIPPHFHRIMSEIEHLLDSGLFLQGKPVAKGMTLKWPTNFVHTYHNPTESPKKILCLNSPPFDPSDEILVSYEDLPDIKGFADFEPFLVSLGA